MITIIVDILIAGAALVAKGAVGEIGKGVGKGVFGELTKRLKEKNNVQSVELVENGQADVETQEKLTNDIKNSDVLEDPKTLELLEEVRLALAEVEKSDPAYAIEGGEFSAAGDILARKAEGLRNVKMKSGGNIDLSGAKSPGK